jgi:DNA-directed RNA polymerase specialized sigma24 family protein
LSEKPKWTRVAQADLRRVARASKRLAKARDEMRDAILQARASGETFRDIAEAAGLSHARIHQIVREGQQPRHE